PGSCQSNRPSGRSRSRTVSSTGPGSGCR
ncbi:uncharacterized protein METZ01_LOCUS268228, partial [marine metagenome]